MNTINLYNYNNVSDKVSEYFDANKQCVSNGMTMCNIGGDDFGDINIADVFE